MSSAETEEALGFLGLEPALATRPARPGELRARVALSLSPRAREVLGNAADLGVPSSLALVLTVECTRWAAQIAEIHRTAAETVRAMLDDAAYASLPPTILGPAEARRLATYSRQLLSRRAPAHAAQPPERPGDGAVQVEVPLRLAAAWSIRAAEHGALSAWINAQLESAGEGDFVAWEAAAAARGETIGEWAQAVSARRIVDSSASAQPHA